MSIGMHCRLLAGRALPRPAAFPRLCPAARAGLGLYAPADRHPLARSPSVPGIVVVPVARLSAGLAHQADLRRNNPPAKRKTDPGLLLAADPLAAGAGKLGAAHRVILAEGDDLGGVIRAAILPPDGRRERREFHRYRRGSRRPPGAPSVYRARRVHPAPQCCC